MKFMRLNRQFAEQVKLTSDIHKKAYHSLTTVLAMARGICHNVHQNGHCASEIRQQNVAEACPQLRSLVRSEIAVLGRTLERAVYELTDYSVAVIDGTRKYQAFALDVLERVVSDECVGQLRSIPMMPPLGIISQQRD